MITLMSTFQPVLSNEAMDYALEGFMGFDDVNSELVLHFKKVKRR